nr:hypothetical protein [Bradyrhizobium sp. SK17]
MIVSVTVPIWFNLMRTALVAPPSMPPLDKTRIGHVEIVAHDLYPIASSSGLSAKAVPVVLSKPILDRNDRIDVNKAAVESEQLVAREDLVALSGKDIPAVFGERGCCSVERTRDVAAGAQARLPDRGDDQFTGFLDRLQVWRKPTLVADRGRISGVVQEVVECVERLRAVAKRASAKFGAPWAHDHELLEVDAGMMGQYTHLCANRSGVIDQPQVTDNRT